MTHDQIAASWALRGDIARRARLRVLEEGGNLVVIADAMGLGGRGAGLGRAWRALPLPVSGEDVEVALSALYVDLGGVAAAAPRLEAQSFSERLAEE
jgi:hypothetical protein